MCNADLVTGEYVPLVMSDFKFAMSDGTVDIKLLALINCGALFKFMSSSMVKCRGWVIRPNTTLNAVKFLNATVMYSSGASNGLALSSVW